MSPPIDTADALAAPVATKRASTRFRRLWWAVPAALIATGAMVVISLQHQATSPEEFASFAQKLDTLTAPTGSFTAYDPTIDGNYGNAPEGAWSQIGTGTWANTAERDWWVAVRGWTTTVTAGQERETCAAVLDWLATTGTQLGLSTAGPNEDVSTCLSVLNSIRSDSGSASDAWAGRGVQTTDGQPRYRTGVETFTGSDPGQVILRVEADATVSGG